MSNIYIVLSKAKYNPRNIGVGKKYRLRKTVLGGQKGSGEREETTKKLQGLEITGK